jgi:hypothetical protein
MEKGDRPDAVATCRLFSCFLGHEMLREEIFWRVPVRHGRGQSREIGSASKNMTQETGNPALWEPGGVCFAALGTSIRSVPGQAPVVSQHISLFGVRCPLPIYRDDGAVSVMVRPTMTAQLGQSWHGAEDEPWCRTEGSFVVKSPQDVAGRQLQRRVLFGTSRCRGPTASRVAVARIEIAFSAQFEAGRSVGRQEDRCRYRMSRLFAPKAYSPMQPDLHHITGQQRS